MNEDKPQIDQQVSVSPQWFFEKFNVARKLTWKEKIILFFTAEQQAVDKTDKIFIVVKFKTIKDKIYVIDSYQLNF